MDSKLLRNGAVCLLSLYEVLHKCEPIVFLNLLWEQDQGQKVEAIGELMIIQNNKGHVEGLGVTRKVTLWETWVFCF